LIIAVSRVEHDFARIDFDLREVKFRSLRSAPSGAAPDVNKVSNAILCEFDVRASSLPEELSTPAAQRDQRVTADG